MEVNGKPVQLERTYFTASEIGAAFDASVSGVIRFVLWQLGCAADLVVATCVGLTV
jgi:hypothetical protein